MYSEQEHQLKKEPQHYKIAEEVTQALINLPLSEQVEFIKIVSDTLINKAQSELNESIELTQIKEKNLIFLKESLIKNQ